MAKKTQVVLTEDGERLIKQLNEETDRGAALAGLAYLDDLLGQLFQTQSLDKKVAQNLLTYPAALSTFGARADIAYCFGWVGSKMYADLKKLQKVRNSYAHRPEPKSFLDPDIKTLCAEFHTISLMFPANSGYISEPRKDFSITVAVIALHLDESRRRAISTAAQLQA